MKLFSLGISTIFICLFITQSPAQTMTNAEQEVRQLFEGFHLAFNAQESQNLTKNFLRTPLTFREGEKVTLINSKEEAMVALDQLFASIVAKGWTGSKNLGIEICVVSDSMVFLDNTYSRLKADGTAIAPEIRKTLQVWQKSNGEWRIVSFYFHDAEVSIGCKID